MHWREWNNKKTRRCRWQLQNHERKRETDASHELLGERLNTNSNVLKRCSLSALSCSTCPFSSHSSPFFFTSRQFCDLYQPVKISNFLKTKSMCGSYPACVCLTTYHFWERSSQKSRIPIFYRIIELCGGYFNYI